MLIIIVKLKIKENELVTQLCNGNTPCLHNSDATWDEIYNLSSIVPILHVIQSSQGSHPWIGVIIVSLNLQLGVKRLA